MDLSLKDLYQSNQGNKNMSGNHLYLDLVKELAIIIDEMSSLSVNRTNAFQNVLVYFIIFNVCGCYRTFTYYLVLKIQTYAARDPSYFSRCS